MIYAFRGGKYISIIFGSRDAGMCGIGLKKYLAENSFISCRISTILMG